MPQTGLKTTDIVIKIMKKINKHVNKNFLDNKI